MTSLSNSSQAKVPQLNLILKADVQGSLEPIVNSLRKLVPMRLRWTSCIKAWAISVNRTSCLLLLHKPSLSFQRPGGRGRAAAGQQNGVDIRQYDIIYRLVDDVDKALKGMLAPVYADVTTGHAEVRTVFRISHRGNIAAAS